VEVGKKFQSKKKTRGIGPKGTNERFALGEARRSRGKRAARGLKAPNRARGVRLGFRRKSQGCAKRLCRPARPIDNRILERKRIGVPRDPVAGEPAEPNKCERDDKGGEDLLSRQKKRGTASDKKIINAKEHRGSKGQEKRGPRDARRQRLEKSPRRNH